MCSPAGPLSCKSTVAAGSSSLPAYARGWMAVSIIFEGVSWTMFVWMHEHADSGCIHPTQHHTYRTLICLAMLDSKLQQNIIMRCRKAVSPYSFRQDWAPTLTKTQSDGMRNLFWDERSTTAGVCRTRHHLTQGACLCIRQEAHVHLETYLWLTDHAHVCGCCSYATETQARVSSILTFAWGCTRKGPCAKRKNQTTYCNFRN
jgi:hypothetical protein